MIVIAILGLLVPGYLLARAFDSPFACAVAFPISALILAETVIAYTCLGIPLRFEYVLLALVAISAFCCAVWLRRAQDPIAPFVIAPSTKAPKPLVAIVAVIVAFELLGLVFRSSLYPLSGFDAPIRWELLARFMLTQHSLSFYPPRTPADFSLYPSFVDGFPPLVSTTYWWLYAAWGQPWAALATVPVFLQAASCFSLIYRAAQMVFGTAGGLAALAVASSTSLLLGGIAIGQETGYTALSYAGQFALTLAAVRQPKTATIVAAGLFAAMGAMSREYGLLLPIAGLAVLACHPATRRRLPLFCLVAVLGGGSWYLRNWLLTGNPFFPNDFGLGLPTNPIFAGATANIRDVFGLPNISIAIWFAVAKSILLGAPLALLVGIPCVFISGRTGAALAIAIGLAISIWLTSISYTSAGVGVSLRVLTPAWTALSIACGALGTQFMRKRGLYYSAIAVVAITGAYSVLCAWSHPFEPSEFATAVFSKRNDPLDSQELSVVLANRLEESTLPPCGLLTDDCYLAVALSRLSRFKPILIWNPEVAFAFDPQLDPAEVRRRLVEKHIRLVQIRDVQFRNSYLEQFFLRHRAEMEPILQVPGVETIYMLPESPRDDRNK